MNGDTVARLLHDGMQVLQRHLTFIKADRRLGIFVGHTGRIDARRRRQSRFHLAGALIILKTCQPEHSNLHDSSFCVERTGPAWMPPIKIYFTYILLCMTSPYTRLRLKTKSVQGHRLTPSTSTNNAKRHIVERLVSVGCYPYADMSLRMPTQALPFPGALLIVSDTQALSYGADQNTRKITLIGVPTDVGAGRLGASLGPDALRVAQLGPALARFGAEVRDIGNLAGPPNPRSNRIPDAHDLRNLDECIHWNRATHDAVHAQLVQDRTPIMLGGDHSLAIGSISAVARHCRATGKQLRVLWLDAHSDCNTPDISPSGNIHGIPVASLCGLGPQALTTLSGILPAIVPAAITQIGLRSVDEAEKRMIEHLGLEVYDMRSIDELGMREVMQRALSGLHAQDMHLHVSFDVDFLDPDIAPGTGTTVRGGPNYREAQLCMEMIADTGRLASLDIVELNPALDIRNQTAELVVDLVESLFGKSTLVRPRQR